MSKDYQLLQELADKLENNIIQVIGTDIKKINLGFISNNIFGASYLYDIISSCIAYDILLTEEEQELIKVIFNTSEYGRYCFK
ncbi:hypothetical protein KNV34_gp41 [uncultured phage cr11_1]|jgi:hypothetical protein|uniref:Uncharacterized protein n=1 Tax=uncultured phage cr11_1 TaxID=2772067 RepID=A0A7M1RWW0_9CAUD|nr:hypothetical protein KNV34_gp41 [uncultured phage cr11_1]UVX64380.1 MAG: hypothetical protein [Bacteriophage sp.]DAG92834.1 MAG TPA: hypothetical protein [Crassvirales sp.]QOR58786.1 hypothetical protein [uncultured phage cr11_1]UVX74602.1 MAG: hypothetical protein [Bacteriophage sp.]UWG13678.1 MAG: hypothetical protein [Bacteriophage sp.]